MLAWDTETCPIRRPVQAPPLVVVSWARSDEECGLVSRADASKFIRKALEEPTTTFNGVYDLAVLGNHDRSLIPQIFSALDNDLIHCAMLRMQLYDIARGRLSTNSKPQYFHQGDKHFRIFYNLSSVHHRLCGTPMEKDKWRLRYAEFMNIPISDWPEGARTYPIEDARATLRAHNRQDEIVAEADAEEEKPTGYFLDQHRQHRAYWALHLMRCWGIRTDELSIRRLDRRLRIRHEAARAKLVEAQLIKSSGSRDMMKVKALMFQALGAGCILTESGQEKLDSIMEQYDGLDDAAEKELRLQVLKEKNHRYVATDSEACQLAAADGHPILTHYHEYVHVEKLRSTYITAYWSGVKLPIQSRFEPLVESGRTSSSKPNIQNLPREKGLREVFVPRKGNLFVACDYDLAELRSLGQVCLTILGYSKLADALNNGMDPHLSLAAQILGISYDEAKRRKGLRGDTAEEEKLLAEISEYRTLAKAANFGFPGGLGIQAFIQFAKGAYKIKLTEKQVRKLKNDWFAAFPEMKDYFDWIRGHFEKQAPPKKGEKKPRPRCTLEQLFSNRVRGRCTFTQAANTYFQGLTADAAKEALYEVARAQMCDRTSPLFGTHTVNFVHDEIIIEAPEARAHECAIALRDIMVRVYDKWTPDVPMTASPHLMRRWTKAAEPWWRDGGKKPKGEDDRLIPWEDRKAA